MENEKKRNTKKSSIPSANRKRELGTRAKSTTGTKPKVQARTGSPAAAPRKPQAGEGGGNRRSVQTGKPGNSPVKRMIIGLIALVLFAALLIGGWMVFYNMNLQPVGTNTENVVVDIPDGSTIDEIARILQDKNLIRNTLVFESYAGRHSRGSKQIQAANYEFNQAMSVPQIFNKMLNGEAYTGAVAITLPEGRNIKEMAEILEKNHVCTAADFIAETKKVTEYKAKYPILGSIPDGKDRTLEGYL
ncbi:MAG: endolytic transglycosylase MltG, partial [Eubacterium sp.]